MRLLPALCDVFLDLGRIACPLGAQDKCGCAVQPESDRDRRQTARSVCRKTCLNRSFSIFLPLHLSPVCFCDNFNTFDVHHRFRSLGGHLFDGLNQLRQNNVLHEAI